MQMRNYVIQRLNLADPNPPSGRYPYEDLDPSVELDDRTNALAVSLSDTIYGVRKIRNDATSKVNFVRVAGDGSGTVKFLGKTPGNQLCVAGAISDRNTYYFLISDLGSGPEKGRMYYIENVDDEPGYASQRNDVIGTFVPGEPGSTMGLAKSGKFFTSVADLAVLTLDAPQKDIIFGAHARELRMVIITLGATPGVEIKEVDAKT